MALTITKTKAKQKAAATNVIDAVAQKYVEQRVKLEAKLAALAALQKEVEQGEKELLSYADTLVAADEATDLQVGEYVVKIGPKGRKAVAFDNAAIKAEIGADVYEQIAQFKIEDLKKYMTGEAFAKAVSYANVNKRKVTIEEAKNA